MGSVDRYVTLRTVRTLALAVLVVTATALAGCGALSGGDGGTGDGAAADGTSGAATGTATPSAEARFESKLSAPPETVLERVGEILGADTESRPAVEFGGGSGFNRSEPFYLQLVGPPENRSALSTTPAMTYDYSAGTVTVNRDRLDEVGGAQLERELAYYGIVSLGLERGWFRFPDRPHGYTVITTSIEYVVDRYARQYRPESERPPQPYSETTLSDYEWARSGGVEYYAYQWIGSRIDSPVEVPALVTEGMPASGEHLLHDTDDEPMALGLALESSERWYRGGEANWYTRGEHGTRAVLETKLDSETAATAAEGWGQDRFAVVEALRNDTTGVVWAHRWDSPGAADEFESAMGTYLDRRREETDDLRFEFRRLAPDVTVLVTGPPAFTTDTAVAYDTGNVTVGAGTSP